MGMVKVPWTAVQAESAVVNCPYDVVGVYTPAGQTLAGPYTVKAAHAQGQTPVAQQHEGAAMPTLVDGNTRDVGTFGHYSFFTLTADTPPADTSEFCYLLYRDFLR